MNYSSDRASIATWGVYEDDGVDYQRWAVRGGAKWERLGFICLPMTVDGQTALAIATRAFALDDEEDNAGVLIRGIRVRMFGV